MKDNFLIHKLAERKEQDALRQLRLPAGQTDFCSNDYLGIVHDRLIEQCFEQAPIHWSHGATGSRLLAGHSALAAETEQLLAAFHEAETALLFNSGYDANLGLLSAVPQRGDTILYDQLSHASLRDGIRLSFAQAFPFLHNNMEELEKKLKEATGNIFVVTESVFSMDGDTCPLETLVSLCAQYGAHLIVDEAHATGIIGERGEGLVQLKGLQETCFARIHTFGKAAGVHGAAILGSQHLQQYLINFARPFMYTTALPPASLKAISFSYGLFPDLHKERTHLQALIRQFRTATLPFETLPSETPIQVVVIPGNTAVKAMAHRLQEQGMDVRPILYPTVPRNRERLRIVLHAFNTTEEVGRLIACLQAVS
jgi:8-amino-7-oxononanoate synthase